MKLLTYAEAAKRLSISLRSLQRLVETGKIKSCSPSPRTRRILEREIDRYLLKITA